MVFRRSTPAARLLQVLGLTISAVHGVVVRIDHDVNAAGHVTHVGLRGVQRDSDEQRRSQVIPTMGELRQDLDALKRKLDNLASMPVRVMTDMNQQFKEFFPGFKFQLGTFTSLVFTVGFGLTWFIVYLQCIYEDDRAEHFSRWQKEIDKLNIEEDPDRVADPDVIFVLHHPTFETEEDNLDVSIDDMDRVLSQKPEAESNFPMLHACKKGAGLGGLEAVKRRASQAAATAAAAVQKQTSTRSSSKSGSGRRDSRRDSRGSIDNAPAEPVIGEAMMLTTSQVRKALLKDLFEFVKRSGFSAHAFASIDNDEIFMTATLRRRKWIKHYLARDRRPLHLRPEVIAVLTDEDKQVAQDASDPACSPPFMPYDPTIMKALADEVKPKDREAAVFKRFPYGGGKHRCVSSRESCQIVIQEISQCLNLDAAVDHGMMVAWFPVHCKIDTDRLGAIWANWSYLKDFTFVQPVPYLRDYFGARIAFFFAWNGLHCKALVILVTISGLWIVAILIAKHAFESDFINDRQVIGLCIIVSLWSKITNNLWRREEKFFGQQWGLRDVGNQSSMVRASFKGELTPSPLNDNISELQYPPKKALLRRILTTCVTLLFCAIVCVVIWTWMLMFRGNMGKVSATILALMVKVFQFIFQYLVQLMVDFENHKYHDDWFNSYLWKLFVFEYVNNYSAFFFLTISNAGADCQFAAEECSTRTLEVLRSQVSLTLFVLVICSIGQVIGYIFMIWLKFKWEDHQYRQNFGQEPPERSFQEEQAKRAKINEASEVQNMMSLVIALGFVLHFGGVSPAALLVCFLVFSVQLRAFAILLVGSAQRVMPQKAVGIGNWTVIVDFLMTSGVLYTGFLFVAYGYALQGTPILTKTTAFAVFCMVIFMAWSMVDMVFPSHDDAEDLLVRRRAYVTKLIMQQAHKADLVDDDSESEEERDISASIATDDWNAICGREKTPRKDFSMSPSGRLHPRSNPGTMTLGSIDEEAT